MNQKLMDLYQKLWALFGDEYKIALSSEGKIEICPKEQSDEKTKENLSIFDEHKAIPNKSII